MNVVRDGFDCRTASGVVPVPYRVGKDVCTHNRLAINPGLIQALRVSEIYDKNTGIAGAGPLISGGSMMLLAWNKRNACCGARRSLVDGHLIPDFSVRRLRDDSLPPYFRGHVKPGDLSCELSRRDARRSQLQCNNGLALAVTPNGSPTEIVAATLLSAAEAAQLTTSYTFL